MATEERSGFCSHCQRHVLGRRPGVDHVLHAIISIFSCGLWVFVWAIIAFTNQSAEFACPICGGRLTTT